MADCNHECSSCATSGGCQEKEQNERAINNTKGVKKVIGVVGGKGGVGKSLVTSLLAIQTRRLGYETAVLDADITGPSIPKIFGIHDHAQTDEQNLLPYIAADGTKVMSLNLLLENETDPVFWRGPVISGVVKQFWEEVSWGDVDFMFGRCAADRIPEPAAGRHHYRFHTPVSGLHDRTESGLHGTAHGYPGAGYGGKYALYQVSGLRQGNSAVRLG